MAVLLPGTCLLVGAAKVDKPVVGALGETECCTESPLRRSTLEMNWTAR